MSQVYPPLHFWVSDASMASATVGSFFYVALAAIGTGLTASCVRWLLIDSLHHATGLQPPDWSFAQLADRTEAYHLLIEIHYQYYLFYGNSVVAIMFAYGAWRVSHPVAIQPLGLGEVIAVTLIAIFFAGSRSSLKRYYTRAGELLRVPEAQIPKIIRSK